MQQEGLRKLGTFIKPVDLRDSETGFVKADLTKKVPNVAASTSSNAYYKGGGGGGGSAAGMGMSSSSGGIVTTQRRRHPIQEEMDQKQIILLDEDTDENGLPTSLTDEDRKFIVPMALKNASPDPRALMATQRLVATATRATTTTTTTKRPTTPPTPGFASNIDDLKKHILFLQNLTKHDSSFQPKFVVFPSLQKDRQKQSGFTTSTTTTTVRPSRPVFQYSAPATPPSRKSAFPIGANLPGGRGHHFGGYYHNDEIDDGGMSVFLSQAGKGARDKITIVPQVLLLNDQTIKNISNGNGGAGAADAKRRNFEQSQGGMPHFIPVTTSTTARTIVRSTTTSTTTTTAAPLTSTTPRHPTKKPLCIRNPDSPKCIRQRKREEQQRQRHREQLLREQREYLRPHYEPYAQTLNNTKRFAVSIEIPDSFKIPYNESADTTTSSSTSSLHVDESELQLLSRSIRSHHKRRNIGGGGSQGRRMAGGGHHHDNFQTKYGASYLERDAIVTGSRDFVASSSDQFGAAVSSSGGATNAGTARPTTPAYSEPIDLNPDNCYHVDGMTYGQKKQCVLHTSVMPAISRGARAAIQECQFQFKNRRWNCSTTEDNTVFGPMTGLGSPEMAFIHALAAALVTSFIARACRDGQLASCGCSRGSRPKQLHDDWTWGGCGDNLEYAYKFATDFIDVREKETRRGTRGAGNPERKRGNNGRGLHQRRNQQPMQQAMQSDDAAAAGVALITQTAQTTTATARMPMKAPATIPEPSPNRSVLVAVGGEAGGATVQLEGFVDDSVAKRNEHISGREQGNMQQQQQQHIVNSNNTVSVDGNQSNNNSSDSTSMLTATTETTANIQPAAQQKSTSSKSNKNYNNNNNNNSNNNQLINRDADSYEEEDDYATAGRIKPEDLLELQERITKEILNSKLQGKEMLELQEKINREILNSKVFNLDAGGRGGHGGHGNGNGKRKRRRKNQRAVNGMANDQQAADVAINGGGGGGDDGGGRKNSITAKARSLMNLHNNEAGRRAVIKKTRITCKCHGVSGSCSLITCWQQLSSIREIGDYLREKYEESTEVKLNKRGRLQVKDAQYKVPTAHDLVYLDESPDWCRNSRQLQWPGTHGRLCNKTSSGLDGCGILCCGRGYNTKNIVVRERCNCKFHWCCQVKCDVCVKVLEEHTCK